ncbi:hypothetical protein B6D60_03400 [candidate division KSB1 bacterium 4484_87]|nr:MAG: hypothetical protein B6D60_03400 [candidate division KSB1 bacterium 4484_87]
MAIENVKGIIFDVHKTLIDDSGFPRDRIWRLIEESGVKVNHEIYFELYDKITKRLFNWPKIKPFIRVRDIHRRRLEEIYRHFRVKRDVNRDLNFLWKSLEKCQFYPEVLNVLQKLSPKFQLALLSNADSDDPLLKIVMSSGIKFETVVTSAQAECYKPDRKIFDFTLEKIGLLPNEVIMVGDSPISDIAGAKNAGIHVIWVNRQGQKLNDNAPKPDWEVKNLTEMYDLFRQ